MAHDSIDELNMVPKPSNGNKRKDIVPYYTRHSNRLRWTHQSHILSSNIVNASTSDNWTSSPMINWPSSANWASSWSYSFSSIASWSSSSSSTGSFSSFHSVLPIYHFAQLDDASLTAKCWSPSLVVDQTHAGTLAGALAASTLIFVLSRFLVVKLKFH